MTTNLELHITNLRKAVIQNIKRKTGLEKSLTPAQEELICEVADFFNVENRPKKGILLLGGKGTGKTTIMQVIVAYYTFIFQKIIFTSFAKSLPNDYKENGLSYFYKRPWFVDDLGKEPAVIMDFGMKYDTWADVFSVRYENQALTFATGNYMLDGEYLNIYGDVVCDRMREHFKILILDGKSLRGVI